jgi:hypothetical protein
MTVCALITTKRIAEGDLLSLSQKLESWKETRNFSMK